jgi:uncharacterized protein YabE (DUF348 family)
LSSDFNINIFRARPVVIVDGALRYRLITPAQTPSDIAKEAGIKLNDKDSVAIRLSHDYISTGVNSEYVVTRAKKVHVKFYGKDMELYTQGDTVSELLADNSISLGDDDYISAPVSTKITKGLSLEIWRNGSSIVSSEESVEFAVRAVKDNDRPAGYREVQISGENGTQTVTYEITMLDGKEIGRKEIARVVTKQPVEQVEIIGTKPGNGLTLSKGVNHFADSSGVLHRETYYDLPMSVVMRNCGQGGYYTVREDGVKVDRDGYVIIAANLGLYPRCSIVETSLGLGKVYDTGGFASVHPHGWDIATDWSTRDGI